MTGITLMLGGSVGFKQVRAGRKKDIYRLPPFTQAVDMPGILTLRDFVHALGSEACDCKGCY